MPDDDDDFTMQSAVDEETHRKMVRKQAIEARKAEKFWLTVMDTAIGRQEMWRLMEDMGAFRSEFAVGPTGFPDVNATFFKLGQSKYGLGLYHRLMALAPNQVILMHQEQDARFMKPKR